MSVWYNWVVSRGGNVIGILTRITAKKLRIEDTCISGLPHLHNIVLLIVPRRGPE